MAEQSPAADGSSTRNGTAGNGTVANGTAGKAELSLSIIIPNYNYAEFIADAIDSALALDWPDVEIIVVDDGSTDDSRAIIERYAGRVTPIFKANAGQAAACNAGFARSRGDVILFLDADDRLHPTLMRELAQVWHAGVSKVQFQMQIIDAAGRPTGALLPQFGVALTPERIRRWALTAAAYPTPPGSGNAYARSLLERIFPLEGGDTFSDSYCLAAAPYFGDVVTIDKPLVCYRVHGRNAGAMTRMEVGRLRVEVSRADWRFRYAQSLARAAGYDIPDSVRDNSLTVLAYRLASARLEPEKHPDPSDSVPGLLRHFARASFIEQGLSPQARSALLLWAALVGIGPRGAAERLVTWRFASSSRPRALRRVLQAFNVLGRSATA